MWALYTTDGSSLYVERCNVMCLYTPKRRFDIYIFFPRICSLGQLLGTCIGLKNIKYFVLFWFWASLLTIAMSTSSLLLLAPKLASHNCENKTLAELEVKTCYVRDA